MKHSRFKHLTEAERRQLDKDLAWFTAIVVNDCANCDNWFASILQDLLRTDDIRAAAVWAAVLSTRARLQLVLNLGHIALREKRKKNHLVRLCEKFRTLNRLRNFLAHSIAYSDKYGFTEYLAYANPEKLKPGPHDSYIDYRVVDHGFINELEQAEHQLSKLSRQLGRFAKSLKKKGVVKERRAELTQRQLGAQIAKSLRLNLGKRPVPRRRDQSSPGLRVKPVSDP